MSRSLRFCLAFLVTYKNGLMRILRLISKFVTWQTGRQIITIHILLNILRIKDNQAMKFGQLIEHNVRNILLQKSPCASPPHFGYGYIFQEKYVFCYVLLPAQMSLSSCLYFLRYWTNLCFLIKPFFYITRKSEQKFKYLKNEKSF